MDLCAPPRAARGFTLIEVLVALALLAVGLVALATAGTFALRHETTSASFLSSLAVAEQRLALLATAPIGQLVAGSATDTRCEAPVQVGGQTVSTVTCTYTLVGAHRLDLAVDVTHPLATNPVHVETSRYVP